MQRYMEFVLESARFHIKKENTLVLVGWFCEDNPEKREVAVELDDTQLEVNIDQKSGIEIRQKYLTRNANVSEEIRGEVLLPEGWRKSHCLRVYSVFEKEKKEVCNIPVSKLCEMETEVQASIEAVEFGDNVTITGWVIGSGAEEFSLKKGEKEIPFSCERFARKDVSSVYYEVEEEYKPGFRIQVPVKEKGRLTLCIKDGSLVRCMEVVQNTHNAINVGKAVRYLKRYGIKATIKKSYCKLLGKECVATPLSVNYDRWMKKYSVTNEELENQRNTILEYQPLLSVVIPMYKTDEKFLCELLDSFKNQTYSNWELCLADGTGVATKITEIVNRYQEKDRRIKYKILSDNGGISDNTNSAIDMANGDYIVFSDHDDVLPANALFEFVQVLNEDSTIDVVYSDEDKVDMSGKKYFEPHFKSDYNIDLLCSMNYICHLFMVKRSLLEQVGGLRKEFDGAQDYDFILRCCEKAENIKHIPKILYHWRCHMGSTAANPESKLYAFEAGRRAVEAHYERLGIPATVEHGQYYGLYKSNYHWKDNPLISIIIPNKDHIEDLKKCIEAIEQKSSYRNFEFIIVENNSTEAETFEYYKELEKKDDVKVVFYEGDFNFSRINNFGVQYAKGEYLLLLNNDTEIINADCLKEMLGYCMREDVGIVGARLFYNDDTIQHAGVVVGFGGIAGHTFIGASRQDNGYFSRIICAQDYSAVTAACMMTKKSIYETVGGLTEEYKVAFNDIDYCLKVRKLGKLVVYNPFAELYHYESKSRGLEDTPEKVERFNSEVARFVEDWKEILREGDPYYNINLSLNRSDFGLRE